MKILVLLGFLLLLALPTSSGGGDAAPGGNSWRQAIGPRTWTFPRDHGAHPDYRTEWWYFTGNLRDSDGRRYGYQLTFFRHGVVMTPKNGDNPWSIGDLYPAHFAISDVGEKDFRFAQQISRAGPGLAGSRLEAMDVWCLSWSARMTQGTIFLEARREGREINLELTPRKPPVLHGQEGLSVKGPHEGNASYYYSLTDLETKGSLRTQPDGREIPVSGVSWFDHEFGSNQLLADQVGWDWFGIHFSDGRELMLYFIRRKDGSPIEASSGTLVEKSGKYRHLKLSDLGLEVLDTWRSPHSGARYPKRWRISVPSAGIDVIMTTLIADQELDARDSTGIVYYEGAVGGEGESAGQPVRGEGYVELTGYAGSLGGVF